MPITRIPKHENLKDEQFIQVQGPDGLTSGFQYDLQQRALYFKESQVIFPSYHGHTHIAEDPVPTATCDTPGLMSADDKCKLDSLIQTRIGVLGFQGAGFPDDGGWMSGDIILAAGTEFISLERIGNVVRFTVDSPIPLNCSCFMPGARVLMHDGTTKAIETVRTGDLVVTHRNRVRRVKQLFETRHDGPIYRWKVDKHSGENFAVTGNHPVMSVRHEHATTSSEETQKHQRPAWIAAGQLRVSDLVSRRRSHSLVADVQTIDVLAILNDGAADAHFFESDGLVYPHDRDEVERTGTPVHGIPRLLPVNDDLLDLIGYYAVNGYLGGRNGSYFTVRSKETRFGDSGAEICRILSTLFGLEPKIGRRVTSNTRDLHVHSIQLARLLRHWFRDPRRQRRFPEWVMNLPPARQARIVAAMFRSAGYVTYKSNNVQFALDLPYRNLIDQCLWMAERCGWEPANLEPKVNGSRASYRMEISAGAADDLCDLLNFTRVARKPSREWQIDDHTMHRIVEWSETYYSGMVYNFEVEEDNSYVVDGIEVHNCEECQQIFWLQDETDIAAIRPPTCGGKLPGVNAYGELKVYLFPESTIVDPHNPAPTLNKKDLYPTLVFKRYDDSIAPGQAEYELILKRDPNNQRQTEIGWAFTPGATGTVECIWFTGKDNDGNLIRFSLDPQAEPGLLGAVLYKGHLLTKKMGVITGYTSTILSTNQYTVREWDVDGQRPAGDPFTAKNVWQYANPENPPSGKNPRTLILDSTVDLLPIGTLVDLWSFKVGEVAGQPIRRWYFSKRPTLNPSHIWAWVGQVQFGDVNIARREVPAGGGSDDKVASVQVSGIRCFERQIWGLTGFDDPLISFDIASTAGTAAGDINRQHRAIIDTDLPGLRVVASDLAPDDFSERPVWLWHRRDLCNALVRADIGRPSSSTFVPYDIVLRAPIDEHVGRYMRVIGKGIVNGLHYIAVCGVHFHDLPPFGTVRVLSPFRNQNLIFNYSRKLMFPSRFTDEFTGTTGTELTSGPVYDHGATHCDYVILASSGADNAPYPGEIGDIVELLHQEYNSPVVRVEFTFNPDTKLIELQFKVGILDMSLPYEQDILADDIDDYVRGLAPGYTVSAIYSQAGTFTGVGTQPDASPEGFVVYEGGAQIGGTQMEYWNSLEIMLRDNQVWIWWNKLLIPPSPTLCATLPTPVTVDTPYFPIEQDPNRQFGKVGMRLWPGALVRRLDVRTQITIFNEFMYGQLEVT